MGQDALPAIALPGIVISDHYPMSLPPPSGVWEKKFSDARLKLQELEQSDPGK